MLQMRVEAMALAAALCASLAPLSAFGQTTGAAPRVGAPVRDASGAVLGHVEALTRDPAGVAVQVVIRTPGIAGVRAQSKALPLSSLRPDRDGWSVPLRRAEFNLLPSVQR